MFKLPLITVLFCASLLTSLSAELIPLKGANGQMVDFLVQSVEADGIRAQRKGDYRFILIRWEQLDLAWLKQNQTDIWQQKQHHEAMKAAAYQDFKFGQSRNEIIQMVQARKGLRVPSEPFNDADEKAIWVTLKPEEMRQFLRLRFDDKDQLIEFQLHTNFNEEDPIDTEMLAEWERLVQLVNSYETNAIEHRPYPTPSDWRRWKSDASKGKQSLLVTHRWDDASRQFELGLESKQVSLGIEKRGPQKLTPFGTSMDITSTAKTNTNWVIYKASLKPTNAN